MREISPYRREPSVIVDHARRSAANSAGFALDRLQPGMRLLDAGCGPGTITCDLARIVAPGEVVGIDPAPQAINHARTFALECSITNVRFEVGDIYALDRRSASFDVVYANQVLRHLARPVEALSELRRILVPGGLLTVREADFGTIVHSPHEPRLDRWLELYTAVMRVRGGEAHAGRHLAEWVDAAAFVDISVTTSTSTYADPASRLRWSDRWVNRLLGTDLGRLAIEHRLTSREELEDLAEAWRTWASGPNAFAAFLHGEVVARVRS